MKMAKLLFSFVTLFIQSNECLQKGSASIFISASLNSKSDITNSSLSRCCCPWGSLERQWNILLRWNSAHAIFSCCNSFSLPFLFSWCFGCKHFANDVLGFVINVYYIYDSMSISLCWSSWNFPCGSPSTSNNAGSPKHLQNNLQLLHPC